MVSALYVMLLLSTVCRAEEAVMQGTRAESHKLPKSLLFGLSESARTNTDVLPDHPATAIEGKLDKLQDQLNKLVVTLAGCRALGSTDTKPGGCSDTATADQFNRVDMSFSLFRNDMHNDLGLLKDYIISRLKEMEVKLTKNGPGQAGVEVNMQVQCKDGKDSQINKVLKNCQDVYDAGHTESDEYKIKPDGVTEAKVYCEQEEDGGGWTVFQQRFDYSENFTRGWSDYKKGFGQTTNEYWLGNDLLHTLTADHKQILMVKLRKRGMGTLSKTYAKYTKFWIDNETNNYKLTVSGYTGTAGNSLAVDSNGSPFTTYDKDNDAHSGGNCAKDRGGWWYKDCTTTNLNDNRNTQSGMIIPQVTYMMIRPK